MSIAGLQDLPILFIKYYLFTIPMSKRAYKRTQANTGAVYHDRIPMEDDYETVQAHTASRTAFNHTAALDLGDYSVPSPWTVGTSWAPEERDDFCLDPNEEWYDETVEAEIGDVMEKMEAPKAKLKKRSQASVCLYHLTMLRFLTYFLAQAKRILEGECP